MIKVAITDDHPIVLTGLQQLLHTYEGITLCGAYLNGKNLLEGLELHKPDVLLLDLQLPDYTGEDLASIVLKQYPDVRILVLTSVDILQRVRNMLKLGCQGYLLKNVSQDLLQEAIRTVHRGELYIEPSLKEELFMDSVQRNVTSSPLSTVTRREKEILELLAAACTSQDIADKLFLSIRTVENHRKSLLHKFDVKNTVAMINKAMEMGILK